MQSTLEYAGEVREAYPGTSTTIVHNGQFLLNDFFPDRFRKRMQKDLEAAGINVILSDKLEISQLTTSTSITTSSGTTLKADLVVSYVIYLALAVC